MSILQQVRELMQAFEDAEGINNIHNAQKPPPFKKRAHWSDNYPKDFPHVLLTSIERAKKIGCEETKKLLTVLTRLGPKMGDLWGDDEWVCIVERRGHLWFQASQNRREGDELSQAEANALGIYRK
jgi:hypothetical protein